MKATSSGNVLFLILIAVALFAALSYAVTGMSRTGDNSLSKDKAKIAASQIIQYATEIENGINRMLVINGAKNYALDLKHSSTVYQGTTSCTKTSCQLFQPEGGGVSGRLLPTEFFDSQFSLYTHRGKPWMRITRVIDVGSDKPDLVFAYFALKKEICDEVNKRFGLPEPDSIPVDKDFSANVAYSSAFSAFPDTAAAVGDVAIDVRGRRTFCYRYDPFTGYGGYVFYHVLIAR
jgi:hypothetical protein